VLLEEFFKTHERSQKYYKYFDRNKGFSFFSNPFQPAADPSCLTLNASSLRYGMFAGYLPYGAEDTCLEKHIHRLARPSPDRQIPKKGTVKAVTVFRDAIGI
jgi:hypothetical protein